ncbi:MAG: polysaccharide deacetylase family protein [Candidatus Geothermincolia bacterium]
MGRTTLFAKSHVRIFFVAAMLAAVCFTVLAGCGGGSSAKTVDAQASVDAVLKKGIKPNEMGMVMVLEYHRVAEKEGNFVRSVENFKKDLETLYQKGYRLVTFHDLVAGRIGVPAGTTPVVFSFDDSTESQIRYLAQGTKTTVDPECALGMMQAFKKKHPDFGCTGLFNVMPELFDQPKYKKEKLDYLTENDYEIGNHTMSHPLLAKQSDEQVQKEIAGLQKIVTDLVPKTKIDVLCLPYGSEPQNKELMFTGTADGTTYHNKWALLVGSNPFYPMYHYKNPGRIVPRIQMMDYDPLKGSGVEGSGYWLRYFDRHPETRFISDGNADTICAPAYMQSRLLPDKLPKGVTFIGY